MKGLENKVDLCPCFITINKYSHYNDSENLDILEECHNYNDNTLLNNTEFNENNIMYISFDKNRKCYCGKMNEMKGISNMLSQKFEQDKKNIQNDLNRMTEENNIKFENKLKSVNILIYFSLSFFRL